MNLFIVIAALMAAAAAAAVGVPLLRDAQSRWVGLGAAFAVAIAAAVLYPLWSNWDWRAPVQPSMSGPDVGAMVAKLEKHMAEAPQDQQGWLLLGRSYLTMERLDEAVTAYGHAHDLGQSADASIGLGEAMSLRAGGEITPPAAALFEEALSLAPGNPKALLYGGFAAATRGDPDLARSRWMALKALHPPAQIEAMLDARIAELGPVGSGAPGAAPLQAGAPGTNSSAAGTSTSTSDSASATATVNIGIAPELKGRLSTAAPLFVFAREPQDRGPPLAAKRLTSAAIGTQIQLSPADSMIPGHALSAGKKVSITARVSFSGTPTPAAGDLYGEISYEVGHDGAVDLLINRVAE